VCTYIDRGRGRDEEREGGGRKQISFGVIYDGAQFQPIMQVVRKIFLTFIT